MRGGATQGMGWALFEQLDHDEDGRLLTGSFLDYAIPKAERVPEIETLIVEVPAPDGPFGAKGIGEAPVVGAPAAIANAVAAACGNAAVRAADDTATRLEGAPVVTALERAQALVEAWNDELRRELPEGARLFDAHTHLGHDIDGMVGGYDELTAMLDRYGFARRIRLLPRRARPRAGVHARRTTGRSRTPSARTGSSSRSSASTSRRSRSKRRGAASTSALAGSSCIRAHRRSR